MGHNLLQYGVFTLVAWVAILGRSCGGRDIRPSDHGLAYNEAPPPDNGEAREMRSFFGGTAELPEAKNISATWWSDRGGSGGGGAGRDRVRVGLLVASGVCGLTGAVLLVISGVVFLLRLRKQKLKADGVLAMSATTFPASHKVNGK